MLHILVTFEHFFEISRISVQADQNMHQVEARLNEMFITDNLTDDDLINYAFTVRDKLVDFVN